MLAGIIVTYISNIQCNASLVNLLSHMPKNESQNSRCPSFRLSSPVCNPTESCLQLVVVNAVRYYRCNKEHFPDMRQMSVSPNARTIYSANRIDQQIFRQ